MIESEPDTDEDGIPDYLEFQGLDSGGAVWAVTNAFSPDTDGDGVSDLDEWIFGLNPNSSDTDGDGTPDGTELAGDIRPMVFAEPPMPGIAERIQRKQVYCSYGSVEFEGDPSQASGYVSWTSTHLEPVPGSEFYEVFASRAADKWGGLSYAGENPGEHEWEASPVFAATASFYSEDSVGIDGGLYRSRIEFLEHMRIGLEAQSPVPREFVRTYLRVVEDEDYQTGEKQTALRDIVQLRIPPFQRYSNVVDIDPQLGLEEGKYRKVRLYALEIYHDPWLVDYPEGTPDPPEDPLPVVAATLPARDEAGEAAAAAAAAAGSFTPTIDPADKVLRVAKLNKAIDENDDVNLDLDPDRFYVWIKGLPANAKPIRIELRTTGSPAPFYSSFEGHDDLMDRITLHPTS